MRHPKQILKAIRAIRGVKDIDTRYGIYAATPHFYIRVLDVDFVKAQLATGERQWKVQFAYRKTFDRWANSTNFETEIWYDPKPNQRYLDKTRRKQYTIPDLNMELKWCKHVAESGIFHWNTYFATIRTPWFIYPKQQREHYTFL